MTWHRDEGPGGRRGYHHGNLREALIKAALDLISEKGASGFTIAEAARAAGVSPAAPYRHYRDRDALMADVALRGFEALEAKLRAAAKGAQRPSKALEAVAHAYLDFARREPAQFAAMFEAGLSLQSKPELHTAGERAFDVVREACEAVIAKLPDAARPPATMMALHVWSQAHGIASLFARGDAARRPIPMSAEDLLDAAVLIYLDGLGAGPGGRGKG
ncbi:MAG: TetR/AcrR family transcriptional regulator [Hyphomicrobium sp.]